MRKATTRLNRDVAKVANALAKDGILLQEGIVNLVQSPNLFAYFHDAVSPCLNLSFN